MRPLDKLILRGNQPENASEDSTSPAAPLGGTHAQAMQRLQIGLAGLGAMVLMIGLANVIMDRAQQTEADAVPQAAATVAAEPVAPPQNDPLAEAGVVPDLPADPNPTPTREPAILPEQGNAPETQP